MKRVVFSVVLSIAMIVSMIPVYSFATDNASLENDAVVPTGQSEATVNVTEPSDESITTDTQAVLSEPEPVSEPEKENVETVKALGAVASKVSLTHIWPTSNKYGIGCKWGVHYGCGASSHETKGHYGVDIVAPGGASVYATASGTVVEAKTTSGGYGKRIVIKHSDGTYSLYAHLSSILVSKGTSVAQGKIIGRVGNTGASQGNHLHYGLYKSYSRYQNEYSYSPGEVSFNPELYLKKWLSVKSYASATTSKPVLSWTKYPGTAKYKIYVYSSSTKKYVYKTSTTNLSYIHSDGKPTWLYKFAVKAVNSKGNELKRVYITQLCKLAKPKLTKIYKTSSGKVRINFTGVKNANVYEVYRATSAGGTYYYMFKVTTKTIDKGGESHYVLTSTGNAGQRYYYKIKACHSKWTNCSSVLSDYKSIIR